MDVTIERIGVFHQNQRTRYFDTGEIIGFQLKCTTTKGVKIKDNKIQYDLNVKNFNDLIRRKNARLETFNSIIPLLLLILVLPEDEQNWIVTDEDLKQVILNGELYWHYPTKGTIYSNNQVSQRIFIESSNKINLDFFSEIFNLFYPKNN